MGWREHLHWRRGAIWFGIFVLAVGTGGVLFIVSGIFNVAANVSHFHLTERIISFVLDRSVAVHSGGEVPERLADEGLVRLGARHFETGCATCHGRPGSPATPIVTGMYPAPPPLDRASVEWTDVELAWIIENGLKMTGMPAWAGSGRRDEVWPLVAYIKALPRIGADEYAVLTGRNPPATAPLAFAEFEPTAAFCAGCHGGVDTPPVDARAPPLHGQTAEYLARALFEYRRDVRQSGMMEPIAAAMDDEMIARLAEHFSAAGERQAAPPPRSRVEPSLEADAGTTTGRDLALQGSRERGIPACASCHHGGASPQFPRLEGLPKRYVEIQLGLFRSGVRGGTAHGRVMATVAERLSDADIEALARYFASARPGAPDRVAEGAP